MLIDLIFKKKLWFFKTIINNFLWNHIAKYKLLNKYLISIIKDKSILKL